MPSHFPTPLPDELFYSLCARYGDRVDYPSERFLLLDLFGNETATASIDLPAHLDYFASALPLGSALTADRVIDKNTLLPFHSHFLPSERVKQIRNNMRQSNGAAPYMCSGLSATRIPAPTHLKFCPECIREDEEAFDAPYWHRLHQLSGVEVCHVHTIFLENSTVSLRAGRRHHQFVSAKAAILNPSIRRLDLSEGNHQALLGIARGAAWLLEHPSEGNDLESLYNRYIGILNNRGLAIFSGNIRVKQLLEQFRDFYSDDFLKMLHCEFSGNNHRKTNWLLKLVRQPRNSHHPLYHLLLMQFLGYTPEEFFNLPEELGIFGEAPWPCLNPVADHYRESVITDFQFGRRQRYGRPRGVFSCECGFSYTRSGPDSSPEDRFRVGRLNSFGSAWEDELRKLWKDSTMTLTVIQRRLGVDYLTVLRHAERLKLPPSRPGRSSGKLSPKFRLKSNEAKERKKRRSYRSKWLAAIKQSSESSINDLAIKLPGPYQWLLHNDRAWLRINSPQRKKKRYSSASVDWDKRDRHYATEVRKTAMRLKEKPGRPIWITKAALLRELGALWIPRKEEEKLPLTAQAIAEVAEPRMEFAIRRIQWVADCYLQEKIIPRDSQIVNGAHVYNIKELPEIRQAINDAVRMIETKLSSSSIMKAAS